MLPRCRIYFFTYKRNYLIPRSIGSLLDQTFREWICEVHNDCPENKFPEEFIRSLNDPRFIVKNHVINLGGTGSFNLAFSGCEENYASILEDDNWWEPTFLEEMIRVMDQNPNTDIAWSNMRIWKESGVNKWNDTGKTTWQENNDQLFTWPHKKQSLGALHSIGAMIYRGINARKYIIPTESLLDAVELIRERSFKHPIYLSSKILANFSITSFTNRSNNSWQWTACQVMLLSSLISSSENKLISFQNNLNHYRYQTPNPIANFFLANLFLIKERSLYKVFNLFDWLVFVKWLLGNGHKLINIKLYLASQNNVYLFFGKKYAFTQ